VDTVHCTGDKAEDILDIVYWYSKAKDYNGTWREWHLKRVGRRGYDLSRDSVLRASVVVADVQLTCVARSSTQNRRGKEIQRAEESDSEDVSEDSQ
jgi:hypothetical protein